MTDKKSSESRRKLLKSIVAGSGAIIAGKSLPEKWTKPVVDSVMLPAHAQTSLLPTSFFGASITPVVLAGLQNQSLPLDSLIPTAYAQQDGPSPERRFAVQAILQGADSYAVTINNLARTIQGGDDVVREGTLNIDGTPNTLVVTNLPCGSFGRDFNGYIDSVSTSEIVVVIDTSVSAQISLTVPDGSGALPPVLCGGGGG